MALRAITNATISFSLVNIPVKLHSAANPRAAVSFRLLSKEGHRLRQQYVDPKNGDALVPRSEMVKGYEYQKDKYVLLSPEELVELQEKSTQRIDISEFVPFTEVPPVYFDKTYYLSPEKGGDRAYRLLSRAMKRTGRCGLGRYAARGKMYLVLISPMDDALAMHQLHYADEVVDVSEVVTGDADPGDDELALASQIIDQFANDRFEPEKYKDEVRSRIERLIERKVAGEELVSESEAPPMESKVTDLMAALKASLASSDGEAGAAGTSGGQPSAKASGE